MIEFTEDERAILLMAVKETYERYVAPYCRKEYQKWKDVPEPSPEMIRFLRLTDGLRVKLQAYPDRLARGL
jgi:hypothetical protein